MADPAQEELWQAYDEQGNSLSSPLTKQQARVGALHGASHVWIWRQSSADIEILLQCRAFGKHTWPGHFDISAAGHIDFDETPLQAAIRETQEEVGLSLNVHNLRLLFVHRTWLEDESTGIIENEFQWVYGIEMNQVANMQLQTREVDSIRWMKLDDFRQFVMPIGARRSDDKIVPHGSEYFMELLKEITRKQA